MAGIAKGTAISSYMTKFLITHKIQPDIQLGSPKGLQLPIGLINSPTAD